jgi:predicted peptidase
MQFLAELKILKKEKTGIPERESVKNILGFAGLIAFIGAVTFGIMLASAWYSQISWNKESFEITKNWVQPFEARVFVNSKGDTLLYRLLKPLNYDPQKKYPLLVSLPYGGQPGTDKIRQVEGAGAAELLSTEANRIEYPAFIFVPNCPPGSGWGGIPGYPSVDTLVYKAIEAVDKEFPIDLKRQYVTGNSRGGYGAWNFICTRPDLFAAAIPVSGAGDPKLASKIVDIPVWAFHGARDHNVPVSGSRDMISAIKKAGGKPKYTEYPNAGHDIWDMASQTPGLWDWLFAQQRR